MNTHELIENLLKPRYKCIADYPGSEFLVGDIFTFTQTFDFEPEDGRNEVWYDEKNCVFMDILEKYPHLFKKLEWWEAATIDEMPEYVKVISDKCGVPKDTIRKVQKWVEEYFQSVGYQTLAYIDGYKAPYLIEGEEFGRLNVAHLYPSTKEEYEKFNSEQNAQVCDATKDDSSNTA